MARPRKDETAIDAKQRIQNSFWELLEDNQLSEITVGMVADHAHCNRGTFYYHYENMDDLIDQVLTQAFTTNYPSIELFIAFLTNKGIERTFLKHKDGINHITLFTRQGGMKLAREKLSSIMFKVLDNAIAQEGQEMKNETKLILEFFISGVTGLSTYIHQERFEAESHSLANSRYPGDVFRFFFKEVCLAQGIPQERMLTNIIKQNGLFGNEAAK